MKKQNGESLLHDLNDVSAILRIEHHRMDEENPEAIRQTELAARVLKLLDPKENAPATVRLLASETLVLMAGSLCANVHRAEEAEVERTTMPLFDAGLQPRYPVTRNDETVYVLRGLMTLQERRATAERLRREAEAKNNHADALDAETNLKVKAKEFDDDGKPISASVTEGEQP